MGASMEAGRRKCFDLRLHSSHMSAACDASQAAASIFQRRKLRLRDVTKQREQPSFHSAELSFLNYHRQCGEVAFSTLSEHLEVWWGRREGHRDVGGSV